MINIEILLVIPEFDFVGIKHEQGVDGAQRTNSKFEAGSA